MKPLQVLLLTGPLMLCQHASAAPADNPGTFYYTMGSTSSLSCGQFLALIEGTALGQGKSLGQEGHRYYDEKFTHLEWVSGFITGANLAQTDNQKQIVIDNAALELWLKNFCTSNPTAPLLNAVNTLAWQRLKGYEPPFAVQAPRSEKTQP